MIIIDEAERKLVLYKRDSKESQLIEITELKAGKYNAQFDFYDVELNYNYGHNYYNWDDDYEDDTHASNIIRISEHYNRIVLYSQGNYVKIIPRKQNCVKASIGNLEILFKKKYKNCNCQTNLSPATLKNRFPAKQIGISIGEVNGLIYSYLLYSDEETDIELDYKVGTFIRTTLRPFEIKGRVDQKIPPCRINFAYYTDFLEIKVGNIFFYAENDLDFLILKEKISQKIAEFRISKR